MENIYKGMNSMVDPEFLKNVQKAGWRVDAVSKHDCIGSCPVNGCGMRAILKPDVNIPRRKVGSGFSIHTEIESFDHIRRFLREQRRILGLSIRDVEEASGIADDHLAKFERDEYSKMPNFETILEWSQSLGFEVVLRKGDLPPITLRMIVDTRDKDPSRQRRNALERQRDTLPASSAQRREPQGHQR